MVSGGARPSAWRKTLKEGWRAARPTVPSQYVQLSLPESEGTAAGVLDGLVAKGGQLLFPFMEAVRDAHFGDRAWITWLRGLDLDSRRAVAPFEERLWHLLMLAIRCPGAIELLESSPALAFALASSWVFQGDKRVQQPLRAARSLLRKRQRVIADWLGFPATESTVRILRRVPHADIRVGSLLYLRDAMHDERIIRTLRHVPQVNLDVIRIVSRPETCAHVSSRLLIDAGTPGKAEDESIWKVIRDTVAMLSELGHKHERPGVSLARASVWNPRRSRRDAETGSDIERESVGQIPPPPIAGTETIVPLTALAEFIQEGSRTAQTA